jgi:N-acetylglucosamine kinase-like BadF-type ATPase
MSHYYLGVDGGQSSTTALIGDETGRVVGFGRGGPCNHVGAAEGRAKFLGAVGGCVRSACEQAALPAASFEAACLGFSGGPADKEPLVREFVSAPLLKVTHDALIALSGAAAGEPGLITIAGTGSIAFGRGADGSIARAGGWGYIFGDEGGGFDITRQALRAALRYEEGWGAPTTLRERLLADTGARDADELLHWFYTTDYPRSRVATFSKVVDQAANEGDAVAQQVLDQAAHALAGLAASVRGRLFRPGEPACVSYIGGVFRSERLLQRFRMLIELEEGNRFGPPAYGPAAGALIEAYRMAGLSPTLRDLPEFEK